MRSATRPCSAGVRSPIRERVSRLPARPGNPPRGGFDALDDAHWQEGFDVTMGRDNVPFNCIAPGRILTERFLAGAINAGLSEDAYAGKHRATVPLGRLGRPDEIGDAIAFLASERASHINGATLIVDGGMIRSLH